MEKMKECSLKVSKKDLEDAIYAVCDKGTPSEGLCNALSKTLWIVLQNKLSDDCKTIRNNHCDLIALTEFEGGEPIHYTRSDQELKQWLQSDKNHSWFPVDDEEWLENIWNQAFDTDEVGK